MTEVTSAGFPRDDAPGDGGVPDWLWDEAPDEELLELVPDPDTDPPSGRDAWLAAVPAEVALAYFAAETDGETAAVREAIARVRPGPGDLLQPGGLSRPGGRAGAGFAAGGVADDLAPGEVLAGLTGAAWTRRELVSDDELVGIARAWRRLASWAQAGELAAISELVTRREAQVAAGADPHIAEHASDEVAIALTLTSRSADQLVDFATGLGQLPATWAALAGGDIDRAKAWVIYESTIGLTPAHAAAVEAAVIGNATRQTTGQLRAACRRAVLAADPAAAQRRREEARKEARVETWHEPAGTAALAGRDLPPADVLAADRRIDALARQLRTAGAQDGLDALRARVYTALLLGIPLQALHSQLCPPAKPGTAQPDTPEPGTSEPGTPEPGTPEPGTPEPGTPEPGTSEPGTPEPGATQPATPEPGTTQPGTSVPRTAATGSFGGDSLAPATAVRADAANTCTPRAGTASADAAARAAGAAAGGGPAGSPALQPATTGALATSSELPLTGSIHLTMPLSTLLGGTAPGEADGFGPLPATDARDLARLLAGQPGTRWCVTFTGTGGTALAHGCARLGTPGSRRKPANGAGSRRRPANGAPNPSPPGADRAGNNRLPQLTFTITPQAGGACQHEHQTSGYQPSDQLRHLVTSRQPTCTAPGCRHPARRCDLDHTIAYDQGGLTCDCNLAPLCRRHHKAKQTQGWQLHQPQPGTMIWTLPHGRSYRTGPEPYPADGP